MKPPQLIFGVCVPVHCIYAHNFLVAIFLFYVNYFKFMVSPIFIGFLVVIFMKNVLQRDSSYENREVLNFLTLNIQLLNG